LAKLSANGAHIWSQRFGGSEGQLGTDLAVDSAGHFFHCGHFSGPIDLGGGNFDPMGGLYIYLAKFGP